MRAESYMQRDPDRRDLEATARNASVPWDIRPAANMREARFREKDRDGERFTRGFSRGGTKQRRESRTRDVTFPRFFVVRKMGKRVVERDGKRERRENLDLGMCRAEMVHRKFAHMAGHTSNGIQRPPFSLNGDPMLENALLKFARDAQIIFSPSRRSVWWWLFVVLFISNRKNTSRLQWADHCLFSLSLSFLVTFGPGLAEANTLWFFSFPFLFSPHDAAERDAEDVAMHVSRDEKRA